MPLLDTTQASPDLFTPLGASPLPEEEAQKAGPSPGLWSDEGALGAAFRTGNVIGSWSERAYQRNQAGVDNSVVPGYSAWNDIKGTEFEDNWSSFTESNNPKYTEFMKEQIKREEADHRTLAAAGAGGIIPSLMAGAADPTMLVPIGGELELAGKGIWTVGRGALAGARATAVGVGAQELGLHATQETRTGEESAINIGTSVVLGGILGGSVAAIMSRPEQIAAENALENLGKAETYATPEAASAGAAAAQRVTLDDLTVSGKAAEKIASTTRIVNPILRSNFRAAPSARQFSQELVENTLYQWMHDEGRSLGAAVETEARSALDARLFDATQASNDIFSEMKKSGVNMSRQDFEEAIGHAMRNGDVGENDFVSRAASAWRDRHFEPFTNEAIDEGMLPADVSVTTAPSYFSRVYNREKMNAQEPDFKARVSGFYEQKLASDYADNVQALKDRQDALDQEVADLRMPAEERKATLGALQAQGDKLDAENADHVERVSRINDLRGQAQAAREAGNPAAAKSLNDEIAKVRSEGGEGLAKYIKQRGALRSRYRKVDLNYAGMSERADAIHDSLLSLQEANVRGIQRLVSRGRTLEKEAQRLDPEKLQQKMSDLRSSFYSVVTRSEKAAERMGKSIEKLKAEGSDKIVDAVTGATKKAGKEASAWAAKALARLEREHAAEVNRNTQLSSISRRLEAAEALDPHTSLAELKASIDDLVKQVSDVSLGRGEKAARLQARLARLDPKVVDARIAEIGKLKTGLERDFYDRWEVKKLGEGVDPHAPDVRPKFKVHADDIANDVFDKITGRAATSSSSVDPDYMTALTRGPLKDRTFNVPDALIEDFLESNIRTVAERYGRTMASDIALTRRFGRADMRDQIATIRDEYRKLRESVTSEADRAALGHDEKGAINDLEAMRDLVRGTYRAQQNSSNYGRLVRALMAFNYIRIMGGVVIPNMGELMRPAMVHGMGRYMNEGVGSLLTNLKAVKLSVKEAQLAGQVTERVLQHRMMSLGEIGDPYRSGTAVERWLTNATRTASKWNGLVYWTDGMKSISSVLSQNRIIAGAISGKDARTLAYLGIDEDMAGRIAKEFATHGETMDKIHVANTQNWTDQQAVRAYRSAVSKDVDSIIVTKSVGDVPLLANSPTGKLILQFRNYNFAAHQRVLLRGLQEDRTQFLSGMVGMTTLGMMGVVLRSWRGGEHRWEQFNQAASNPGFLIGEGLDAAGVFTLPIDAGNTIEKITQQAFGQGINPIKSPMKAAGQLVNPNASMQGSSTRFASVGAAGAVLGPSFGLAFDTTPKAAGAAAKIVRGEKPNRGEASAAQAMIPFNSYVGVKEALQLATDDSPYAKKRN